MTDNQTAALVQYGSPDIIRHSDGTYRVYAVEDLGRGFTADVWIDLDPTLNETDSVYKRHSKPEKQLASYARNLIAKHPAP